MSEQNSAMFKPLAILLVDDDADWRMLLREALLAELGDVDVREAASGAEALKVLGASAAGRPDLICLDIQMPGMGGLDLLRSIKSCRALRSIPMVVVTGHEDVFSRDAAIRNGASGYASKSAAPKDLVTKVLGPLICPNR